MFKSPLPGPLLPPWRLILLSDGSVTRHLQLLSGRPIEVVRPSRKLLCFGITTLLNR